jgi:tetratricopeptide (TPR) repeat protein
VILPAAALLLFYAYNSGASERAFASLAAGGPPAAIAYWGEALAAGPNLNESMTPDRFARGGAAIAKAVALRSTASPEQRAFIDAMALRYKGTWDDWDRDDAAYSGAMEVLAATSNDPDAAVLAAEVLLERGGLTWTKHKPASEASQRALALIQNTLARDPANVMANHLCIHIYDAAPDRMPAIPCAQRLDAMTFQPEAEHLAHMPVHTWIETGAYDKALASSERAYALFVTLKASPNADATHETYEEHDAYTGYSSAMMLGNYATAKIWSDRASTAFDLPFAGLTAWRFGRYADAYAATDGSVQSDLAVRGYAALRLGKLGEARSLAAKLQSGVVAGYTAMLFLARLAEAEGKFDEANRWIDRAMAAENASFENELLPLQPALEARGGLALRRGRYADAATAFRAALAAYPNDPRAFFGLAAALTGLGQTADATAARAQFDAAWKGADTTLTIDDL